MKSSRHDAEAVQIALLSIPNQEDPGKLSSEASRIELLNSEIARVCGCNHQVPRKKKKRAATTRVCYLRRSALASA